MRILHQSHPDSSPFGSKYDYRKGFSTLDVDELTRDVDALMTDSKDWWPADWGHYGPFFIRMSWHAAGTCRVSDGGGGTGAQGRSALRRSTPGPTSSSLPVTGPWRRWRALGNPLASVQMGLIYVKPEGPNGVPDAMRSAQDIRETFGRMAMNDEETVALTVGGHTFGKMHGAVPSDSHGPEPEAASLADQGVGWANWHETGFGEYTLTSGLEGAWTPTPTQWDNKYLDTTKTSSSRRRPTTW